MAGESYRMLLSLSGSSRCDNNFSTTLSPKPNSVLFSDEPPPYDLLLLLYLWPLLFPYYLGSALLVLRLYSFLFWISFGVMLFPFRIFSACPCQGVFGRTGFFFVPNFTANAFCIICVVGLRCIWPYQHIVFSSIFSCKGATLILCLIFSLRTKCEPTAPSQHSHFSHF